MLNIYFSKEYNDGIIFNEKEPRYDDSGISNLIFLQENRYEPNIDVKSLPYDVVEIELYINHNLLGRFSYYNKEFVFSCVNDDKFFSLNLYIGVVLFSVVIKTIDGALKVLYSKYHIVASKYDDNNENIQNLLDAIYQLPNEWVFNKILLNKSIKHSIIEGKWKRKSLKSIVSYIKILDETISFYIENLNYFISNASHKIKQNKKIISFNEVRKISQDSIKWLLQNSSTFFKNNVTGILYRGNHYIPTHIQGEIQDKDFNTYENQIVKGFLLYVLQQCTEVKNKLLKELEKNNKILNHFQGIKNGFYSSALTIKSIQVSLANKYIDHIIKCENQLINLNNTYNKAFKIDTLKITSIPRCTKIFQEIKIYKMAYEYIIKWIEFGDFSLERENILFNIKTLDELFEYYCLLRLIGIFIENGWEIIKSEKFDYKNESNTDICNTYYLKKEDMLVTLYYQPIIYNDKFENNITLFRTTSKSSKYNYYTPDFLIKLNKNNKIKYAILDSKYSDKSSIIKYHLDDILLKYMCEISCKNTNDAIKMIWILQGKIYDNNFYNFQNSTLSSRYYQGPSIAIQPVNFKSNLDCFWKEFTKCVIE